jgi:hypothetical protein
MLLTMAALDLGFIQTRFRGPASAPVTGITRKKANYFRIWYKPLAAGLFHEERVAIKGKWCAGRQWFPAILCIPNRKFFSLWIAPYLSI